MAQGFNGSLGVLIKYRRLKFNGRDIIVGYASEFGRGAEAKEAFVRGLGVIRCRDVMRSWMSIYSITGEKMPENNPCDLVGRDPLAFLFSGAVQQSLAADGAIACFSSSFFPSA